MQENEVLAYLVAHPEFLAQHAAQFGLSPKLGDVIALSDKQLATLRHQHQQLQQHLELLQTNAALNDRIQQRQQTLTLALLAASDTNALIRTIDQVLGTVFDLPSIALKLWHPAAIALPNYCIPSDTLTASLSIQKPICTHYIAEALLAWLPKTITFQSFALLPLVDPQQQSTFGLLLIGSEDAERFAPTLQNHYLQNIAEQISTTWLRLLG